MDPSKMRPTPPTGYPNQGMPQPQSGYPSVPSVGFNLGPYPPTAMPMPHQGHQMHNVSSSLPYPAGPGNSVPPYGNPGIAPYSAGPQFPASAGYPQGPPGSTPYSNAPQFPSVQGGANVPAGHPNHGGQPTPQYPAGYCGGTSAPLPPGGPRGGFSYSPIPAQRQRESSGHTQMTNVQQVVQKSTPTVRPAMNFDANSDAAVLRKAMKGFGTDEKAIIEVLANRTNEQRQIIERQYKSNYGKDLIKDLKSELSGHFEDTILALMTPKIDYYVHELYRAIAGAGTNEDTLIEILCSVSNDEMQAIARTYRSIYNASLEEEVMDDTSGHFKRLLVSLCLGNRGESTYVDRELALRDAEQLYGAGEATVGTDESAFNEIFATRSFPQLKLTFEVYQQRYHRDMPTVVEEEFSGSIKKALLAIVKMAKDKNEFFAEQLRKSMEGLGTKDKRLIRLIVTRSEKDLGDIKLAFQRAYGQTLEAWIADDTSGDYKRCLLALCQ